MKINVILMAGGSGSRLWPISRSLLPKQFLKIGGNLTMLQETINRVKDIEVQSFNVICNEEHRFFVSEQLAEINVKAKIILEPFGRNTGPAISLAAFEMPKEDSLMLVLSADHYIRNIDTFIGAIKNSIDIAKSGKLVTFGIVPSEPHIGYGYIKTGKPIGKSFEIESFTEKPSSEIAHKYFKDQSYLWNSGMFLFTKDTYLSELKKYSPSIFYSCQKAISNKQIDNDFIRIDKDLFETCISESIDYAVMEKTKNAAVTPLDAGWSDIGSWSSLYDITDKDEDNNCRVGDIITSKTTNSYIHAENQLIATVGIDNLVIVSTKDSILVANKSEVESIKEVVSLLKKSNREEWKLHREVLRPWGKYDSIANGDNFQVKVIDVKPGAKLSLQLHHKRAEHWIVVKGIARVTKGEKVFDLNENESTFIPLGETHSLENATNDELKIIEVQSGTYFGEDDIVRFEDVYGRIAKK